MKKDLSVVSVGVVGVGSSFIIPSIFGNYWLGALLAFIFGVGYFAYLLNWSKSSGSKQAQRNVMKALILLFIINAGSLGYAYMRSQFQKNYLKEIRQTIDQGALTAELNAVLFDVFSVLHEPGNEERSVNEIFADIHQEKLRSDNTLVLNEQYADHAKFYYEVEGKSEISIIAVTTQSWGKESAFENYNNEIGRFQMRGTVTRGGIEYEREN